MPRTHYETLGVKKNATQDQIRTAYRGLVLKHHPDRSKDPKSTEIFIQVTQAYEVLSDPTRRRSYDALQSMETEYAKQQEQVRTAQYGGGVSPGYGPPKSKSEVRTSAVTMDVTRLTMLFSRAQFSEAEVLAKKIINTDARQPIPYAVLGDIARSRGQLAEAAKMYALAVQMQPENALYHKRYEELLRSDASFNPSARSQEINSNQLFAPLVGASMVLLGCFYLAVSRELPFAKDLALISTWTLGLVVTMFLSGVAVGASLATAGLLDRLQTLTTNVLGRPAPTMTLGFVAAVSFWAAALLYGFIGASQRSFNLSTTRLVVCVAASTALLSASAAANGIIDGFQVLLWGGNLVYLGGLCGWTVADSFRR